MSPTHRDMSMDRFARSVCVHIPDGLLPVLGFLIGYSVWGQLIGVGIAIAAAAGVATWRLWRGDRLWVVGGATAVVVVHAVLAAVTEDSRNFFVVNLVRNGALFLLFAGSLLIGRPVTRLVDYVAVPILSSLRGASTQTHVIVTAVWSGLCLLRLTVCVPLYLTNMIWALAAAQFLLGPPLMALAGWWSVARLTTAARKADTQR